MKRFMILLLALLFACSASAEEALMVNGMSVSAAEARIYLLNAESSYSDIVSYYRDFLGIDYWSLTTANGTTAAEAVKSDVFRELIMLNIFCRMALDLNLSLTDEEQAACLEDARAYYASLSVAESEDVALSDVAELIEKQRLADYMYSLLLSQMEIDEEAVIASVNPDDYRVYDVSYLFSPETSPEAEEALVALRDESDWSALPLTTMSAGSASLSAPENGWDDSLYVAASSLEIGETSDPVKTDYGLFLLRLTNNANDSAYLAAVSEALYTARANAFAADYTALYNEAEYTINVSFWDSMTLGSAP